jgi:hypothetical protein
MEREPIFGGDMNAIKIGVQKVKDHVKAHPVVYTAVTTALIAGVIMNRNGKEFEKFLIEKGIDPDEYFIPEEYEEKLAKETP